MISLYIRGDSLDVTAAVYGSGLLLVAELAYWSLGLTLSARDAAGVMARRAFAIASLVLGALGLGLAAATAALSPLSGSLLLTAIGVMATIAILGLVAYLGWALRP